MNLIPRRKKKRLPRPEGYAALAETPRGDILIDLEGTPSRLIAKGDEMIRGAMLWMAMAKEEKEIWEKLSNEIIDESIALEGYIDQRSSQRVGDEELGALPVFFAYLYYLMAWYNTISNNPQFKEFSEVANTTLEKMIVKKPLPFDYSSVGYG